MTIDEFLSMAGIPNTGSGEYVSAGTAESLPAVMNAVAVISEAVATMPCYLYMVRNDKGREAREWLDDHPVDHLLNETPNDCQTAYQFKRTMMRHCLLNGNAYAVIRWGRDGQPQSLHPYAPGAVVPERISEHRYKYTITEPFTGEVRTYLQEEILHLRYATDDGFLGRSPITVCRETLGLGLAQQRHGASIMKDGMMAAGIVKSKDWLDSATVERFIAFSRLCPHVKGPLRGQPIVLEPWQQFAFACLLGFRVKATGRRKFKSAYIQVPRKNTKSTVAAMLANWFLVMEHGQQDIYTAAVSRDQARIVFDDARQMCLLSKPLKKRLTIQQHKMIYAKSNSLLKPLAAKAATIEGTNPSLAIVDEYHLHPDNGVYSALELGMGARPEGLLFAITTSGSNVVSACKQHYDYCCQILAGEETNDSLFALIYELDDESEIDSPALWIKANPNLNISVDGDALADTIQKARGIPSQWVEMLTKRFNIWCQGATPWMGAGAWAACKSDYTGDDLQGMECYAGLDLSSTGDITSVCYAFPSDREIRLLTRHYLPEAQLNNVANKNRAIYRQWAKAGWIRTTPGDCIDYDRIRDDILRDAELFGIKLVGFDTWNATHLRTQLQGAGLDVEPFPQTYLKFSPVAKSLEVFVNRKVIRYNGDPVLAWAIGNVVMESDANANIKPNKKNRPTRLTRR